MINYITRSVDGITINGGIHKETGLRQYINQLCLHHGSSLDGRISSARYLLKRRLLVPIVVHENLCLISTTSLRTPDVVYLNVHQIAMVVSHPDTTIVQFFDGSTCAVKVSKEFLVKQQSLANQLLSLFSN